MSGGVDKALSKKAELTGTVYQTVIMSCLSRNQVLSHCVYVCILITTTHVVMMM